jgi:multidrug efflux system membrane fusion protein
MAKRLVWLVGLAAAAGVVFSLRDSIRPILPGPLVAVLDPLVSVVEPLAAAIRTHTGLNILNAGAAPAKVTEQREPAPEKGAAPSRKGGGGAAPVTVASAALADMPVVLSAPGTVEPLATVAIKPRVDGQVVHVGFSEGDMVQAGDVLYRLDDRLVRAQIKQAEAAIAKDQASLKDAMAIAERRETLFQKRYATEAATETARQNVEVLKASIAAGQAQLEMQRTQLDYLTIRAPITGRTGSMTARLGAFVRSADPTALLTINQTRPIAVAFALPQAALRQLKDAMEAQAEALIRVSGAKPMTARGVLRFVDNQIDRTTGTVTAKVMVENEGELLWPGLAVNVDLTVETRRNVVTVPASAVLPAQQGMIVWVVGADNRVAVRTVVQDRVIGQSAFVSSGLNAGERVVTDGQLRLTQGAAVFVRGDGQGGGRPGGVGQAPAKGPPAGNGGGG